MPAAPTSGSLPCTAVRRRTRGFLLLRAACLWRRAPRTQAGAPRGGLHPLHNGAHAIDRHLAAETDIPADRTDGTGPVWCVWVCVCGVPAHTDSAHPCWRAIRTAPPSPSHPAPPGTLFALLFNIKRCFFIAKHMRPAKKAVGGPSRPLEVEQEQLQGRQTHDEEQPPSINNPMHARPSSASSRSAGSPGEQAPARSFAPAGGPQTHRSEREVPKEEGESVRASASVHS